MIMKIPAVLSSLLVSHLCTIPAAAEQEPLDYGIFDWMHNSEGGYVNPKQEFRYENPDDPTNSYLGVFAKERIEPGEILVTVPWYRILTSDDPNEVGQMTCGTVKSVARELALGEQSEWAPYVKYLNDQPEGQLPSAWSEAAQLLLQELVGGEGEDPIIPPAFPMEWLKSDWYDRCGGLPSDLLSAKAALLVVQRSDDVIMIPAYDMYNHRNGKWMNTETYIEEGEKHESRALRSIEPGEQLYISYNMCRDCGGRTVGYGSAGKKWKE
jgi:hypothetical protein